MAPIQTTVRITVLHLTALLPMSALRSMLAADWYVLAGNSFRLHTNGRQQATGWACYTGTSDKLGARMVRTGVSLRNWTTTGPWRLQPGMVILINASEPLSKHTRFIVEARLARGLSADGWTVLNTHTGAPIARDAASRAERFWADQTAEDLLAHCRLLFHGRPALGLGGSAHEQLVRLLLTQQPPRAMNVQEVLAAARAAGLHIPGAWPTQRTRRDLSTRESDTGQPRIYRTHIGGRAVLYPASMTRAAARRDYRSRHPAPVSPRPPSRRTPACP